MWEALIVVARTYKRTGSQSSHFSAHFICNYKSRKRRFLHNARKGEFQPLYRAIIAHSRLLLKVACGALSLKSPTPFKRKAEDHEEQR